MKRLLIFSDSRWRDSFGDALLVEKLSKKHLAVAVSYDLWRQALNLFKPHLVILNHLHGRRNQEIASHVTRQGGLVTILPTEGRPNTQDLQDWFFGQLDDPKLAACFAWNDLIDHPKIVVSGHPRFSIYGKYKGLIEPAGLFREKYGIPHKGHVVGIISSFPQAKFAYTNVKFNEQDWEDLGLTTVPGREDPRAHALRELSHLRDFQLWIQACMRKNPEYHYILKPHPMEDMGMWDRFCDEHGITLIRQEYIFNVLNATSVVLARVGCITVQEAWLSNVMSCRLRAVSEEDSVLHEVTGIGPVVDDPLDTDWNMISDFADSRHTEYLAKYGYTHKDPAETIANWINEHVEEVEVVDEATFRDIADFHKIYTDHSVQNAVPLPTQPHLGKSVTLSVINEWRRRL